MTAILFLIALMPIAWMHFAWNRYKDPHDEQEGHVPHPRNKLLCFLYQTSIKVNILVYLTFHMIFIVLRISFYIIFRLFGVHSLEQFCIW